MADRKITKDVLTKLKMRSRCFSDEQACAYVDIQPRPFSVMNKYPQFRMRKAM